MLLAILVRVNDREIKVELQIRTQVDFGDHIMDIVTIAEHQQERVLSVYLLHSLVFLSHNFVRRYEHPFWQGLLKFFYGEIT